MAATGGKTPFDQANALAGPARTVWALPTVAEPTGLYDIVAGVADSNGEYPLTTGWNDFGLAADAPTYSHGKDASGLEYQQPTGVLFEQITDITRQFTAQIAEITPESLAIIENVAQNQITTIAAAANRAALKKVPFGLYSALQSYRIAMISYRPDGAGSVTEPGGLVRPTAVALVLPVCRLSADESSLDFERGTPTNAGVTFRAFKREGSPPAGTEHGYWVLEDPGTIAAA